MGLSVCFCFCFSVERERGRERERERSRWSTKHSKKEKKFLFQKFLERDLTNMCCDLQSRNTWQYFLRCCCKDLLSLLIREILFLLLLPKLIGRQWAEQLSLKIISMIPLKGWLYDWTMLEMTILKPLVWLYRIKQSDSDECCWSKSQCTTPLLV